MRNAPPGEDCLRLKLHYPKQLVKSAKVMAMLCTNTVMPRGYSGVIRKRHAVAFGRRSGSRRARGATMFRCWQAANVTHSELRKVMG